MKIKESNVTIDFDDGKEFERVCRGFCRMLKQLGDIEDEQNRKVNIDMVEMVMNVLNRQFAAKTQNQ
ncbi:MAG: hypothetical protein JW871_08955 [Endomicrobiales bacterium]|nr:hypothetical protein [Endomicrobiales bacterium]